jgi:hypothetical protein
VKRRRWGGGLPGRRLSGGCGGGDRRLSQPRGGGGEKSRRRRGDEAPRPRCPPALGEGERAEGECGEDPPPFSCGGGGLTTRLLSGARAGCGGAGAGAGAGEGEGEGSGAGAGSASGSGVLRGGVMSSYSSSSSSSSTSSPLPRGLILLRVAVLRRRRRCVPRVWGWGTVRCGREREDCALRLHQTALKQTASQVKPAVSEAIQRGFQVQLESAVLLGGFG